jgi:tricorn protease
VLRYQDWVEGRKAYVSKAGGVGFGYMHIPDMVQGGATEFLKSQMANGQKDAVVVDFRGNTGGFVSSILLESFAAKRYASFNVRAGGPWTREAWAFRGHLAALCDEENFSDGELVIEGWKNLKIGPVVGKRTGGGEVGSGGGFLMIDGGKVFVPNYGAFVDGKWIIEGYGATPTIEVDQDPAAVMAGKDPQIDRAIAELQAWLKREPIKDPKVPVFPKKLKGSRGG